MYYTGSNAFATLRQGLVGAWCPSLPNGGSGNLLPDQSGRGNHGTLTNMSAGAWVSSGSGRALDFDGVNDYVLIGSPASIAGAYPQFTKSLWVLLRNTSFKYLFADFDNLGTTSRLSIYHDTQFHAFQNTATVATSTTTITTGVWYHVAVTRDDGTGSSNTGVAKIYINGNLEASATYSYNSPALQISGEQLARSNSIYGDHPDCQIDDARIYSRALSDSEIRLLASRRGIGLQPSPTKFIAKQQVQGTRRRRILTGQT